MTENKNNDVTVRHVTHSDKDAWNLLYRGYRDFYNREHDATIFETTWSWIMDENHEVRSLIAELDGEAVGLANFRAFAKPIDGKNGIFLDDLFTTPEARGNGVGTALMKKLEEIAATEGAIVVRWITASDNDTAQRVYDRVSDRTSWVTYDLKPNLD